MAGKAETRKSVTKGNRRRADRGPGKRLTLADRYRLLETHKAHPDWTWVQLADATGIGMETCRLTCIAAGKSAADLMAAYAAPMLKEWIGASRQASKRGDHRPARDWLLHAGSIDPMPESSKSLGTSIVIVNNPLPGMPGS